MSTAAAQLCACSCGRPVVGKAVYFDAACRQRAHRARPEKPVYPHYLSATERLNLCARHGEVYREHVHQFQEPRASGQGMNYGTIAWIGSCSACSQEERARLEVMERPRMLQSRCELRTCDCLKDPPKCPYCHQPMQLQPNHLPGFHEWACGTVPAFVEVRPVSAGDPNRREMAAPERQRTGEHHRSRPGGTLMTSWRAE